jgi:hypothetical protein
VTLAYLDECGFSPSQPLTASWTLSGRRKRVPYENPQGRRVNAIALLVQDGPAPLLLWDHAPRTLTSEDVLLLLDSVPRGPRPLVVVLDNGSIHRSRTITAALPELAARQITLYYLPPYSPELNAIEPVFGGIKAHELPERAYPTVPALGVAIDDAFTAAEERLLTRCAHQLGPPA